MNKWLPQVLGFAVAAVLSAPTPAHCPRKCRRAACCVGWECPSDQRRDRREHDARFLIDTGSNMSMIWEPAAERLGLRVVTGPKVKLYGLGGELIVSSAIVTELRVAQFEETERRFPVAGDLPTGSISFSVKIFCRAIRWNSTCATRSSERCNPLNARSNSCPTGPRPTR